MDTLSLISANLLSPIPLAFALGLFATFIRSDLRFPDGLAAAISIYLLFAIGLKGGAQLAETNFSAFVIPALAAIILGALTPIWCYGLLRRVGKFRIADAAAIAAHYGSVSAVTFSACTSLLDATGIAYEGYAPALLALMEIPGIAVALLIARSRLSDTGTLGEAIHEVFTGKGIILLIGGLVIGWLGGKDGLQQVAPFFVDPFKGALTLFLLDLGMLAARQLSQVRNVGFFLIAFGIVLPIIHGVLGVWIGDLVGLSIGGSAILGVLAASASYIAAPAAVRVALPDANPGYYLTAALGITFPFNLAIGMPLYLEFARRLG
jgi:uncharacterized protein